MSPAFTALNDVLFAGAMVRMNVLFDGDPTLSVLGLEGREQFSTVILGRVPSGTWRRFAPVAGPAPRTADARTEAASTSFSGATSSTRRRC